MNDNTMSDKNKNEDVDIADFLRLIGRGLSRIGMAIKWVFVWLYELVIGLFLFLKRKWVWLALGAVAGIAFAVYVNQKPVYSSTMTIKSNLENSYFLYAKVNYLNSLISSKRVNELAKEFGITPDEASSMGSFNIEAIKNGVEVAKLYKQTFFTYRVNRLTTYDTTLSKSVRLKDFEKSLTDEDYPLQQITLYARNPDIYPKVQQNFINSINNDPELKGKKDTEIAIQQQEEGILTKSLEGLDTLRQVYNKKLVTEASTPSSQTQLVLSDRKSTTPELDLYDKSLIIKDELMEVKRKNELERTPVGVYAAFGQIGMKESSLKMYIKYGLYAAFAVFLILLAIEFFKFLVTVEKNKAQKLAQRS